MSKKNIVIFIVFTLISGFLSYMCSVSFFDFIGVEFLTVALIAVVSAAGNVVLGAISGAINIVCAYIGGGMEGVMLSLFAVLFALLAGCCIKNKCSTTKLIFVFSVGFIFSVVAYIAYKSGTTGVNVIESFVKNIKPVFQQSMNEYLNASGLLEYQAVMKEFVDSYFVYIQNMIPSIFVIMALTFSFLSCCIVSLSLRILRLREVFSVRFSEFICDRTTTVVFLLSGALAMFMNTGVIQTVFTNIFAILLFVFQVCGFSLLDGVLKRKGLPTGARVLIMLVSAMFATSGIVLLILIIAAALDSFRNFRAVGETDDSSNNDNGSD